MLLLLTLCVPPDLADLQKKVEAALAAEPTRRTPLLRELEALPGEETTADLGRLVNLARTPEARQALRDVLQRRLRFVSARRLSTYLKDPLTPCELRLAATRAAATRTDRADVYHLTQALIAALDTHDPELAASAADSLHRLTAQDLGRNPGKWKQWVELEGPVVPVHAQAPAPPRRNVQPSIGQARNYLYRTATPDGTWEVASSTNPVKDEVAGATALCATALLAAGMNRDNRTIASASQVVRRAALRPDFNDTTALAHAIVFLDRLESEPFTIFRPDATLIRRLATRLLQGRVDEIHWGDRLGAGPPRAEPTHHAITALLVARKYLANPLTVDSRLTVVATTYRQTQLPTGGWAEGNERTASGPETAGALIVLAREALHEYRTVSARDLPAALVDDPSLAPGRNVLEAFLRQTPPGTGRGLTPTLFWLGRLGPLLQWRQLGDIDWYDLGAAHFLARQAADGSFVLDPSQGKAVDTARVLLFLTFDNPYARVEEPIDPPPSSRITADTVRHLPYYDANTLLDLLPLAGPDTQASLVAELAKNPAVDTNRLAQWTHVLPPGRARAELDTALARRYESLFWNAQLITLSNETQSRAVRLAMIHATAAHKNDVDRRGVNHLLAALLARLHEDDVELADHAADSLKALTRQDFGRDPAKWSHWFATAWRGPAPLTLVDLLIPSTPAFVQLDELFADLPRAAPRHREARLRQLEQFPGDDVTLRLARAIPTLPDRQEARDSLADRLRVAGYKQLAASLDPRHPLELRRAALRAAEGKGTPADPLSRPAWRLLVHRLIALLLDPDSETRLLAQAALTTLTGEQFKTLEAWEKWWDEQRGEGQK